MLMLAARSSLYKRHGLILANGVGIVDEDYSGDDDEILVSVLNVCSIVAEIEQGERIAQGIFVPVSRAYFVPTDELGESRGGFGSTGTK
jgi:dUTP pyrophosphatase